MNRRRAVADSGDRRASVEKTKKKQRVVNHRTHGRENCGDSKHSLHAPIGSRVSRRHESVRATRAGGGLENRG
jgi:hypothetical protein